MYNEIAIPRSGRSVQAVQFESAFHNSFIEYAMSVLVERAIPDVRDGLKPVHRRIVYGMFEGGFLRTKAFRKSAKAVGHIMGNLHPHGDAAIYDALVRMAQDFSMRVPLVESQGNFGSIDGDQAAAMRYTEARMSRAAHDMVEDIGFDTVDMVANYDSKGMEPVVLPSRIPNILINGGTGIAVGMASNIPTHNPQEAIDAAILMLDNPAVTLDELMEVMPGPDFPTGGIIKGVAGVRQAYETGRGPVRLHSVVEIEGASGGRHRLIVSELPYMVNKALLIQKIAELVKAGRVEGISDIADESGREEAVRIVIDVKKDFDPYVVLNHLKRQTNLVVTYSINSVCLSSRGVPTLMGVRQMLSEFVEFRKQVVLRRTRHLLTAARAALKKQIGLYAAVSMVDRIIDIVRNAPDADAARAAVMQICFPTDGDFSELLMTAIPDLAAPPAGLYLDAGQADAILSLRLRSLNALEREVIAQTARELSVEINGYLEILNNDWKLVELVRNELLDARSHYKDARRTQIELYDEDELNDEDFIEKKDVVLTITNGGYVKRTPLDAYRQQRRGGKGRSGMQTKDDDAVITTLTCTTHTPLLFVTSKGMAYSLKAWRLPEAAPAAKGRSLVNFLPLDVAGGESVSAVIPMPATVEEAEDKSLVFVTSFGTVRRSKAKDFVGVKRNGKIAMSLTGDDGESIGQVISVMQAGADDNVVIVTRRGQAMRFRVGDLRVIGSRKSTGVRGVKLAPGDSVVAATVIADVPATHDERQAYLNGGEYTTRVDLGRGQPEVRTYKLSPGRQTALASGEEFVMTISEYGFGKKTSGYAFRTSNRGGKGLAAMNITAKTGEVVAFLPVADGDGLVLVTDSGQIIRISADQVRVQGRVTQGVKLIDLREGQKIVAVSKVPGDEGDDEAEEETVEVSETA